jgi:hypothetical protein
LRTLRLFLASCFLLATLVLLPTRAAASGPTAEQWHIACDDELAGTQQGSDPDPNGVDTSFDGPVDNIYPVDTSLDTWYLGAPCDWSISGFVPGDAIRSEVRHRLLGLGITARPAKIAKQLGQIGGKLASLPLANPPELKGPRICGNPDQAAPPGKCYHAVPPRPLDGALPFQGRDVIYVHGLMQYTIVDRLLGVPGAAKKWPNNRNVFYNPSGYWKSRADAYWRGHITRNLRGGIPTANATNRYLTVAWASTQRARFGIHAVLSQIADAMISGQGVINDANPSDTGGFCSSGCVIVSHSTGGLMTDASMARARETTTDPTVAYLLGNLHFITAHMRAHVALHPTFSGSALATPPVAAGAALATTGPLCKLAKLLLGTGGANLPCTNLSAIKNSVLFDLVPQVAHAIWGPRIAQTPVPTLTVAGAHPTADPFASINPKLSFLKRLFSPGLDDGVLTGNTQCASPNPPARWPSGYIARRTPLDVALNAPLPFTPFARLVFDFGNPDRGVGFYLDQRIDRLLAPGATNPARVEPYYTAAECLPSLAPDGMVQPVDLLRSIALWIAHPLTNPLNRYANHYSFLLSTSDHYTGPTGPYQGSTAYNGLCYEETFTTNQACQGTNVDNNEEVRAITDPFVYSSGLVSQTLKTLPVQVTRGKHPWWGPPAGRKKKWIWKRTYHLLDGWETLTENDYVYRYVLR